VDAELPLDQVQEAQRRMEHGELFGKIVVRP
jgi:NADPH:quinone reductase-like Zn-dependent oxidoreductase